MRFYDILVHCPKCHSPGNGANSPNVSAAHCRAFAVTSTSNKQRMRRCVRTVIRR